MAEKSGLAKLVTELVDRCSTAGLALCHWKSNQRLPLSVMGRTDLDLSIPPTQELGLHEILLDLGFLPFLSPPWSKYSGVSDWLGFDAESGILLHVHLHTRLLTGAKSVKEQDLPWLHLMNAALQHDALTRVPIPAPAFEYHLLLAREAIKSRNLRGCLMRLRGRPPLDAATCEELRWLWERSTSQDINAWGGRLWDEKFWSRISELVIFPRVCADRQAFQRMAGEISIALAPWCKGHAVGHALRFLGMRLWQMLAVRWAQTVRGVTPGKRLIATRAPIIAFVGSDGAGKSSVTAAVERWLGWKADIATLYFGSNNGWYRRLRALIALLWRRSAKSHSVVGRASRPIQLAPWLRALQGILLARMRLRQQRRAVKMSRRGTIILGDRWPQAEVGGLCDGPIEQDSLASGWLVQLLRRYELTLYQRMSAMRPDLVIKLTVPIELAKQRKPDHPSEMLARKIEIVRGLRFEGAQIVEVDASKPLTEVVRIVQIHLWDSLRKVWEEGRAVH